MAETEGAADGIYRVLSLDGGGAKGFYTLGVLREIEALIKRPLCERFDLVFGTSTGAIIAALLALGHRVDDIHALYKEHVPTVMQKKKPAEKSAALETLGTKVFGDKKFDAVKTGVGIVATKWIIERPMIFKGSLAQAHGRMGTFVPGFGCTISDAVQASCSAYPFFNRKTVTTAAGDNIELVDGGYCANDPALYAIADATVALKVKPENVRVVSVGVGVYPARRPKRFSKMWFAQYIPEAELVPKTFEINTQSLQQLREILFKHVPTIRINEKFEKPEMATDMFEHDLQKLNILHQRGSETYAGFEEALKGFLL
jgi:uncharacterized protein